MGGFGSGRYRTRKKRTAEGCHAIDTAALRRWGWLKPGTERAGALTWGPANDPDRRSSVGYRLVVGEADGVLRLRYTIGGTTDPVEYDLRLVTTGCHFGGVRWWFVCPLATNGVGCGRRVRKLYLRGQYFGCRHCHGLTYTSSQESDGRVYALLRGGLDSGVFDDPRGKSITQLGLTLKALTLEQRRLDRLGKRLDRNRCGRTRPAAARDFW